jgi:hypothetical protein
MDCAIATEKITTAIGLGPANTRVRLCAFRRNWELAGQRLRVIVR